jgi:hypothetical protein
MMYGVEMGSSATILVHIPCVLNTDFTIQRFMEGGGDMQIQRHKYTDSKKISQAYFCFLNKEK